MTQIKNPKFRLKELVIAKKDVIYTQVYISDARFIGSWEYQIEFADGRTAQWLFESEIIKIK